jgi:hypothetical protein
MDAHRQPFQSVGDAGARTHVMHARGVFSPEVLRTLRQHLATLRGTALAQGASEREQRAIARGESSDALRLDPTWFEAFLYPSRALLEAIGPHEWVSYPPQVRRVRSDAHLVPWHQDVGYQRLLGARAHRRHITCFVPLDDDPQRRPSIEFARSSVAELAHVARDGFAAGLDATPDGERVAFALALGDALLFGDLVPHRTYVPDPARPERHSLEFRLLRPADAVLDKDYFDVRSGRFTRRAQTVEVA